VLIGSEVRTGYVIIIVLADSLYLLIFVMIFILSLFSISNLNLGTHRPTHHCILPSKPHSPPPLSFSLTPTAHTAVSS
jgi:hypothetical protein